jgi:hypothetical protein
MSPSDQGSKTGGQTVAVGPSVGSALGVAEAGVSLGGTTVTPADAVGASAVAADAQPERDNALAINKAVTYRAVLFMAWSNPR